MAFVGASLLAVPAFVWLYALTNTAALDAARPMRSDTSDALLQELVATESRSIHDD